MILETTNPHCFTYKMGELLIELLGGIRIDTLERMRVTTKVNIKDAYFSFSDKFKKELDGKITVIKHQEG